MDQTLFHLINERWTSPALDLFMAAVSDADVWKPLLVIIVFAALIFGGFRARASIFCLLIANGRSMSRPSAWCDWRKGDRNSCRSSKNRSCAVRTNPIDGAAMLLFRRA